MKKLLILFIAISCSAQTHLYKVSWQLNQEIDVKEYAIYIGVVDSLPIILDSLDYTGTFNHDSLKILSDTAVVLVRSDLDGKWIYAGGTAGDHSNNISGMAISPPLKKDDRFAPGEIRELNIRD